MSSEEIFRSLERDVVRENRGYVWRRVLPESPFDIRLEVASQGNNRRIGVRATSSSAIVPSRQTKGFVTAYDAKEGLFRVELQDSRFGLLFSALVDNFLEALNEASSESDPAEVLMNRLALWQRLFEELGFDGLTDEAQRGLFAELRFLGDTLLPLLESVRAVEAWKAPSRISKDFVLGAVAVEVKSRLKKAPAKVRISSEHQLDLAGFNLFLVVVTLDTEAHGGQSLPELVQTLRESLADSGVAIARFDDMLVQAGYLDIHRDHYTDTSYISTASYFQIHNGFPRITASNLPSGVSHVAYDLDLETAASFAVGIDTLKTHIRGEND